MDGLAETLTAGAAFTTTVALAVLVAPAFVPVQEYVVVVAGLTTMLAEVSPVLHTYVSAPEAVNVVDCPSQIVEGDATIETLGKAITTMVTCAVFEQPFTSVPVTVYVVVTLGLTVMLALVSPVLHRKFAAPLAVSVAVAPRLS